MEEEVGARGRTHAGPVRSYALQRECYDDTKGDELLSLPDPLWRPLPTIVRRAGYCPATKQ